MAHDTMRQDAPAAQAELDLLKLVKVGDIRHGVLFPALGAEMEWECKVSTNDRWEFLGRFCGQAVFHVVIVSTPSALVLDLKEMA